MNTKETLGSDTASEYERLLNLEQLRVVKEADGPCLVLAGAGSGKTRVLIYRTIYLLERGVDPSRICLLTFTNKAAREMTSRIEDKLGSLPEGLIAGTFHHVANIFLRRYARYASLPHNYVIIDREDSRSIIREISKPVLPEKEISPEVIQALLGLSANTSETIKDIVMQRYQYFSHLIARLETIEEAYNKKKRELRVVDYDDLLSFWLKILTMQEPGEKISEKILYILVDEYQDTNRIQALILYQLARKHRNITVVGDDAQSIYSFRGATVQNILEFPKIYPDAKIFHLPTNYRSTADILNLANNVISHNKYQFPKVLKSVKPQGIKPVLVRCYDKHSESIFVVQRIQELLKDVKPSDIGILFRSRYQSTEIEIELNKLKIPYVIRGGLRFFEMAHIKDILAFFRVCHNSKDEMSWFRILNLVKGIGKTSREKIVDSIRGKDSIEEILSSDGIKIISPARAGWQNIKNLLKSVIEAKKISEQTGIIVEKFYREYLYANYLDAEQRIADIESLKEISGTWQNIEEFISQTSLQEHYRGELKDIEGNIVLSTIHQAKGLEWRIVFVIGVCAFHFPHNLSQTDPGGIEEERRIFYVGITRAKEDLYITYYLSDPRNYSYRKSLFIEEIPDKLIDQWVFD
ncbi:MAG TPA: 3'-5' exonuclease [Candidatus Ratteibacteria bacterium]|jgi:DNA helicase-2/ATP-dependent DNA helicase PcrA|nr:3'-5' exonuclease [bacterium]HOQ81683.1 3'-5' exonuclease [bacterium]HQL64643.1 3'-5' exonuclease [bacterium]HRS06990.1 3'-5' exonuclease [Candidatus Ratteibacteria bacterium]HRV04129.1 3'-5' exonuclease [Candidatus Ratteibacteria bacterium]